MTVELKVKSAYCKDVVEELKCPVTAGACFDAHEVRME